MTPIALGFVVAAGIAAGADWWVVWRGRVRWRPLTKPAVMVLLLAAAFFRHREASGEGGAVLARVEGPGASAELASGRGWLFVAVIAAGVLSLLGDVLLLPQVDVFVGGLASFLLAHVAYVVAFCLVGLDPVALAPLAALGLAVLLSPVLVRVVKAVRATEPPLVVPVLVYCAVIVAMAGCAIATRRAVPAIGALVFVTSDAQLAWNRFVVAGDDDRRLELGCISTYHVAQALLLLSIA